MPGVHRIPLTSRLVQYGWIICDCCVHGVCVRPSIVPRSGPSRRQMCWSQIPRGVLPPALLSPLLPVLASNTLSSATLAMPA
jgi:hypothetical protein